MCICHYNIFVFITDQSVISDSGMRPIIDDYGEQLYETIADVEMKAEKASPVYSSDELPSPWIPPELRPPSGLQPPQEVQDKMMSESPQEETHTDHVEDEKEVADVDKAHHSPSPVQ